MKYQSSLWNLAIEVKWSICKKSNKDYMPVIRILGAQMQILRFIAKYSNSEILDANFAKQFQLFCC